MMPKELSTPLYWEQEDLAFLSSACVAEELETMHQGFESTFANVILPFIKVQQTHKK
jgi:hypothetical protein